MVSRKNWQVIARKIDEERITKVLI